MIAAILLAIITMPIDTSVEPPPHPRILLDASEWADVRAKVEKYDWAKKSADDIIGRTERWNVPTVRNANDPKPGDWLFVTTEEHNVMAAGMAYQLTGEAKFAEKVRTFLLRFSDPTNGYPVTGRACHQSSVQEGHFFQHLAMAYDMTIPSGVFTPEDRQQIDASLRKFVGEGPRDLGSTNISNWIVSLNTGMLYCALVTGDIKAADWILNSPGGVLDQFQRGTLDDGWWYECSVSYNVWCATMYSQAAIALRRWGVDLVNASFPGGYRPQVKPPHEEEWGMSKARWGPVSEDGISIKKMWDALPPMLDYRGMMFGLNDSTINHVGGAKLDIAYYLYRDPAYAAVIKRSGSRDLLYGVPELPDGPDLSRASAYADNAGVVVLRSQTENRPQREQIQAVLHYGDHGWYHGHFDRTNLLHLSRYGRSFYHPMFIWYGYPNYMYKFYVQTSVSKNMVVVDQKMQEPVESQRLVFHSGSMMQASAVQTHARWSNPPYGGMVYWEGQPHKVFADKAFSEGRSVPIPDDAPAYGQVTGYTEPILQRRLMIVTDDYVVLADYLKGEQEHTYESLFQMKGFQGLDAEEKTLVRHTGQWNPDPIGSAQFVTDCNWYEVSAPARGRYEFRWGEGADNAGTYVDANEAGVLHMDLHTLWPQRQEIMIGTPPETHGVNKHVTYAVRGDGNVLQEGRSGVWILGQVEIDVPVDGVQSLELETRAGGAPTLFWANARIVTHDGNELPLLQLPITSDNTRQPEQPGKDYAGGPIKIAGVPYEQAIPAQPHNDKQPSVVSVDLTGVSATRFKCVLGGDFPIGDETQRRKTVAQRIVGREARFLTLIEPFETQRLVTRATAESADTLRVELADGRVQTIQIANLEGDGSDIRVTISESDHAVITRSESTP
jgi:hypothetical protein